MSISVCQKLFLLKHLLLNSFKNLIFITLTKKISYHAEAHKDNRGLFIWKLLSCVIHLAVLTSKAWQSCIQH